MPANLRIEAWAKAHGRWMQAGAAVALFALVLFWRTRGVTESMWLYGDQVRDWQLALGAWRDLPLAGPPSSIGGTGWGPAFYWVLWSLRHLVGPWTDNLPHAGGIGIAIVQSLADALLVVAIWRRTASPILALAVVLIVATDPFDLAISGTIWNPPVAVAFTKMAMAIVMLGGDRPSVAVGVLATAAAWIAVQCHSTAVFLAGPVILSYSLREAWARRWMPALRMAGATIATVAVLQIPLAWGMARHTAARTSSPLVVASVAHALAHPSAIHLAQSFASVVGAFVNILAVPVGATAAGIILVGGVAATAVRLRRDLALASITVLPLVCLVLGFVTWDRPFETHWCLALTPSLVLTIGLAITSVPWAPLARAAALVLLAAGALAVPSRLERAATLFPMPEYGPLVRGSRAMVERTHVLRAVRTSFAVPPSLPTDFLYRILGGRIAADAPFIATIQAGGHVTYEQAQAVR